ncbi:MAG: amidohydrolase family protein [Acidobacteria bacterium]|nr:amidohydrolase family protein [Acidobacteriota bacterium]
MHVKSIVPLACFCFPLSGLVGQTLIRDVRVFDGERAFEHRDVLIESGKISRIAGAGLRASKAEIVEGRGRTLLPGLFDAHLHVPQSPEAALRQLATLGVTTVFDMAGGGEKLKTLKRIEAEDPAGMADVRASGSIAVGPDSVLQKMSKQNMPDISSPEQAPAWVDARIAEGSDYIKVVYDEHEGGPMSRETLQAIIEAAHKRGKMVVVHILAEQKAREAIEAGADGLGHLFFGNSAGADFGQLAAKHHVFIIPTLVTLYGLCGKSQGPVLLADPHLEPYFTPEQRQLSKNTMLLGRTVCNAAGEAMRQLIQAHVPVLAGTDTSLIVGARFGVVAFGATLHGELKLLVENGMTPLQALAAATSAPAHAFHLNDRGLIRPGMRADLLLVEGDPTRDILATRNIVAVWKKGVRVPR